LHNEEIRKRKEAEETAWNWRGKAMESRRSEREEERSVPVNERCLLIDSEEVGETERSPEISVWCQTKTVLAIANCSAS